MNKLEGLEVIKLQRDDETCLVIRQKKQTFGIVT